MKQIVTAVLLLLAGFLSLDCQGSIPAGIRLPEHSATKPVPRDNVLRRHEALNEVANKGGIDLVFLGDSITREWDVPSKGRAVWQQYYAHRRAANFGVGAERTEHVLWRIDNGNFDGKLDPKLIVLMIGTNNVRQNTAEEIADGVMAIVWRLRRKQPQAKILLLAIFPRGHRPDNPWRQKIIKANSIFKQVADGNSIVYLDIGDAFTNSDGMISQEVMADHLHLTALGYRIWAESIEETVSKLMVSATASQ